MQAISFTTLGSDHLISIATADEVAEAGEPSFLPRIIPIVVDERRERAPLGIRVAQSSVTHAAFALAIMTVLCAWMSGP